MTAKRAKKIAWAVVLLLLAAVVILNAAGLLPKVSILGGFFLAVLLFMVVEGIAKVKWGEIFIPLSLMPYVMLRAGYLDMLGVPEDAIQLIDDITPWPLLLAAILLSIAFGMLFGKNKFHKGNKFAEAVEEFSQDDDKVSMSNSFGETSKYVNSTNFKKASINNSFGQTKVYFNNTIINKEGAVIDVDNSFGQTNIYLPSTWRVEVRRDNAFGSVKEYGRPNADMDAPLVVVNADTSFGEIDIFYN